MLLAIVLALFGLSCFAKAAMVDSARSRRFAELPFSDTFSKMAGLFGPLPDFVKQKMVKDRFGAVKKHVASQSQTPNRAQLKGALEPNQMDLCPYSVGGYHVLMSESFVAPEIGALECAKYGWQYGIVPNSQWQLAAWAISNCTYLSVGVRSYNGFDIGGCQLMQGSGVFLMSQDTFECSSLLGFPLLCYEGPLDVSTETIYEDTTTTVTEIVTVTTPGLEEGGKRAIAMATGSPRKPIDKEQVAKRRKQVKGKLQGGYDVCPSSTNGYYMVYDYFNHADSYQVCADLGLYLADVDTANFGDLLTLFDDCQPFDVIFNVNSYGGVASGLCRLAYFLPWYNVWGLVGVNPNVCFFLDAPIICQSGPITATATVGTATASTVFMTYTEVLAINTETVTETQFV